MAAPVLLLVLAAAAAHASWNAIAKAIPDQRAAAGLLSAAGAAAGTVGALVLPVPDRDSWPSVAVSALLQAGYLLLLVRAYGYGEFSQVYPLARGPPLLVTVVSVGVLGERLTGGQLAGVLLVSLALTALVFSGGRPRSGSGLGLAAATGVVIATYTLVDGVGVRHSGHPLSYAMWLFLIQGILVLAVCWATFGPGFGPEMARSAGPGHLGGLLAVAAYATVLWAQSRGPKPSDCQPGPPAR